MGLPARTCSPTSHQRDGSSHRSWACFHTSIEQCFDEAVRLHRNLEEWRQLRRERQGDAQVNPRPEPTLEEVRLEHVPSPVVETDELAELVGLCLWETFSDNHEVIVQDGRLADIGSFRGAGAFLEEHLTRGQDDVCERDCLRFYVGTI